METLKDKYLSTDYYRQLARDLKQAYPRLDERRFYHDAIDDLDSRELMTRIRHTSQVAHRHLPADYRRAVKILYALGEVIQARLGEAHSAEFGSLFMHDFIGQFGRQDYDTSITALRDLTHHCSSEFAIREYLQLDLRRTLAHMQDWSEHDNEHIRRLASEGCRPRLPWGKRVPALIQQQGLTWPILEALKQDNALYVRKSVANHINDIAKDHADWIPKQLNAWDSQHQHTQWIIKHGCRSLIKQGHAPTLKLLGYGGVKQIELSALKLSGKRIPLGDALGFSFKLSSTLTSGKAQKLVVDYKIHYMKHNGQLKAKVFKLKSITLKAGDSITLTKQHRLADYTTRKHYPGRHLLEITINGHSMGQKSFTLTVD